MFQVSIYLLLYFGLPPPRRGVCPAITWERVKLHFFWAWGELPKDVTYLLDPPTTVLMVKGWRGGDVFLLVNVGHILASC